MTPVEICARAICAVYNEPFHVAWEETKPEWQERYRRLARAVLLALRDNVSEEMVEKPALAGLATPWVCRQVFRTMLDAALSPKSHDPKQEG